MIYYYCVFTLLQQNLKPGKVVSIMNLQMKLYFSIQSAKMIFQKNLEIFVNICVLNYVNNLAR